jgi:hypothetical protein
MASIPSSVDRLLSEFSYLPRVTQADGLAIEDALGGATLLDHGVELTGVILDAPYAAMVRRTLRSANVEPPSFEHLDRWLALVPEGSDVRAPSSEQR